MAAAVVEVHGLGLGFELGVWVGLDWTALCVMYGWRECVEEVVLTS